MTWPAVPLGTLASFAMGQAPPSAETNTDCIGTPFYRSGEFGDVRPTTRIWTTQPLRMGRREDVFICVVGANSGEVNLGDDGAIGRSVAAITPDDRLDQRFLFHLLSSRTDGLRKGAQGSAQGVLTKRTLAEISVPLPPIDEQRRLVELLEDHLSRLDAAQHLLRRNEAQAVALQEAWLKSNLAHERNGDWLRVGDVVASIRGGWSRSARHLVGSGDGVPYLKMNNLTRRGRLDLRRVVHVEADGDDLEKYGVRAGDVLFNSKNSGDLIGKTALADSRVTGSVINENITRLRFDARVVPGFAAIWFLGPQMRRCITDAASASTNVAAVYQKDLISFPIWVPNPAEQSRLAAEFDAVRVGAERLQAEVSAARRRGELLRRAMLDAAFSGRFSGAASDLQTAEELIGA